MKKHISIFLCAALAFAACTPQSAETADDVYQGIRASVEMSSDEAIPADGGQLVVTLHRSPEFTVSVPKTATWLSYSQADSVITFKAGANPSAVLRYARVGIIDKDLQIAITNFDVMQAGTAKDVAPVTYKQFSVSPEEITVEAKATSATFTVTADDEVAWTVTSDNSAFTADPASGNGKKTVTVSFPANTAKEVVKANLTVSTASTEVHTNSYVIAISQEAAKDEQDAVKPAAGTVLAEWEFETGWIDDLRKGGIEGVSLDDDNLPGNVGDPYVPSLISGNGKLEYFNGIDKSAWSTKKHKRRIGTRGELCVYGSWTGDWFTWTAPTETGAPLAAGTKIQLNFALRPNAAGVMRDWKCEVLDGDSWKELDGVKLEYHSGAADTADDPKQVNAIIVRSYTLTKDTPNASFRFTCSSEFNSEGAALTELVKGDALRFAGRFLEATEAQAYLQVPENPKIMVVE